MRYDDEAGFESKMDDCETGWVLQQGDYAMNSFTAHDSFELVVTK